MLEFEPDNVNLLVENARIARIDQDVNKAKNFLLLAMQKEPKNSLVNVEYGLLLFETGFRQESVKFFERANSNLDSNNFIEFLYLLEVFWGKKYFSFCQEIVQKLIQKKYKKKEVEFLEKLYDNFVIDIDIRLIDDSNQLLTIILLAKYLEKTGESELYVKLAKKRFDLKI